MEKVRPKPFLFFIILTLAITGCAKSSEVLFEPGWTHYEDMTLMRDLSFDQGGYLWAVGYKGVAMLDPRSGSVVRYTAADGLSSTDAVCVDVAPDGRIWVGLKRAGASSFDGGEWVSYTAGKGLVNDDISSIAVSTDGTVWFGTREGKGGLERYDGSDWTIFTEENGLTDKYIVDMAEAPDGKL